MAGSEGSARVCRSRRPPRIMSGSAPQPLLALPPLPALLPPLVPPPLPPLPLRPAAAARGLPTRGPSSPSQRGPPPGCRPSAVGQSKRQCGQRGREAGHSGARSSQQGNSAVAVLAVTGAAGALREHRSRSRPPHATAQLMPAARRPGTCERLTALGGCVAQTRRWPPAFQCCAWQSLPQ